MSRSFHPLSAGYSQEYSHLLDHMKDFSKIADSHL